MSKAIEDFVDGETFRAIKAMSLPEINRYLYTLYSAGYAAGMAEAGGERLEGLLAQLADTLGKLSASAAEKK